MSWDSFCKQVKKLANQTAEKVNRSADIATLQFKLNTAKGKLEDAYTVLGKAAYAHFAQGKATESEKISVAMESIDLIKREITEIKAQIEELKKESAKEEDTEKKDATGNNEKEASKEETPVKKNTAPIKEETAEKASSKPLVDAARKEEKVPLGDDFSMSVSIASESAESEGAISLKWD